MNQPFMFEDKRSPTVKKIGKSKLFSELEEIFASLQQQVRLEALSFVTDEHVRRADQ